MKTPASAEVAPCNRNGDEQTTAHPAAARAGNEATPPGGILTVTLAEAAQLRALAAEASLVARKAGGIAYQLRRLLGDR